MSHELRTPLNAVLGFAQLLELDLDDAHCNNVQQIRRAGRHLLNLINDVLDISRIEAGELTLSAEPVQVEELIAEAVALIRPLADAAGVNVDTDPGQHQHVRADRQRMRQVMLNLFSNAVKYNHRGGRVIVRCRTVDEAWVAIEVADTGIGLSPADQARLFTPFDRLCAAGSNVEGTGVGLALSQRLAQAMGGQIRVDSTLGKGSTFTVELPRIDAYPLTAATPPLTFGPDLPCEGGVNPDPDPARAKLLCIEDNPANVRLLEAIVSRRPGWQLTTVGHGHLGLDLATADPPDLLLLDLHLPDIPGIHVLQRLQASPATAAIPVVIVSADATPGQVERLHAAGAQGYLTKPIEVATVLALLDRIAARVHETGRG